jgi:predicted ArsR family transcriptional regulator
MAAASAPVSARPPPKGPPKIEWAAVWPLIDQLGVFGAAVVGWKVDAAQRRGEPFEQLGPPADDRERLSRQQAAPLLLLYRTLKERLGDETKALEIARAAALAGGRAFLARTLGKLDRATLDALDDDGRQRFADDKAYQFFNATLRWEHIGADEVRFTVTACHFPRLCAAVGMPELAPLFCETDAAYFGSVEPDVVLERPHTLATGGESCPFRLLWASGGSEG